MIMGMATANAPGRKASALPPLFQPVIGRSRALPLCSPPPSPTTSFDDPSSLPLLRDSPFPQFRPRYSFPPFLHAICCLARPHDVSLPSLSFIFSVALVRCCCLMFEAPHARTSTFYFPTIFPLGIVIPFCNSGYFPCSLVFGSAHLVC